jgi:hypothetical protein
MTPGDGPAGRRLALLVATANYGDAGLAALRAPTSDVRSLGEVLRDDAIGGFEVRELIDRPTEELKKEIEAFFGAGRPKDLLMLYVSGHGVLSQNRRFYLATTTTALELLRSTAIEDSFVNDVMQQSRARSIVLVLDCCHSGAFGRGLVPKSALSVDVEHRFEGRGRITLTASTELEYAFEEADPATGINSLEPAAPGSLFTHSVVEGLRTGEADIDEDGHVSVDDLYDYVCRRVRERSPNQTPGMAGDVRGQIVLARSPRRPELPPELAAAADSNLAGIREGAASELGRLLAGSSGALAVAARAALERLAADDSRRVSAAALAALGRPLPEEEALQPEPEPVRPEPTPTPPPPPAPPPRPEPEPEPDGGSPFLSGRRPLIAGVAAAAVVIVVVAVLLLGGGSDPGPTTTVAAYDFDGDNRQDAVLGLANAGLTDGENAGLVVVLTAGDGTTLLTGTDVDVPAPLQPTDRFGTAVASGDFDRNGRADLAISVPGRGILSVQYGVKERTQLIRADNLPEPPETHAFGFNLVARDFNRDGYADLAVGAPGVLDERKQRLPGSIHIIFGGSDGLSADSAKRLEPPKEEPGFGTRLAAGDIDRDGNVDLVEGAADESYAGGEGHLSYCAGTPAGPAKCRDAAGGSTSSLAIADVDGDRYPDVIQGDAGADDAAGAVRLRLSGKSGLGTRPMTVDQDTADVPGDPEAGDEFGHDVIGADIDGDRRAEVIVAARGDEGSGSVTVIRGSRNTFGGAGGFELPYTVPADAQLGATLSLLDVNDDELPELFVGVKAAPTIDDAIVVYPGADGGFGPGEGSGTDLAGEATVKATSPLRIGR